VHNDLLFFYKEQCILAARSCSEGKAFLRYRVQNLLEGASGILDTGAGLEQVMLKSFGYKDEE
jgi:hypothetical protein